MKARPHIKWLIASIVAILLLFVVAPAGFFMFTWRHEPGKEREAILVAESLNTAQMEKLISDSKALAEGKPFSLAPYTNNVFMWDEKRGFPVEFQDIKPLRIYIDEDEVVFMTYKLFDTEVSIVVLKPKSEQPSVVLRTGLDEHYRSSDRILYKKAPNQAPETTIYTGADRV
jgi:hypothetical protein